MATNLIQNLESRSTQNGENARVDDFGAIANYYSCYSADHDAISLDGNLFKLVIDLGD